MTHTELDAHLGQYANLLEVPAPTLTELRDHARQQDDHDAFNFIEALER